MHLLPRRQSATSVSGGKPPLPSSDGSIRSSVIGVVRRRRRERTNSGLSTLAFSDVDDASVYSGSEFFNRSVEDLSLDCPPSESPPSRTIYACARPSSLKSCLARQVSSVEEPTSSASTRAVQFGKVHIREYATILSDSLSTSAGLPIGIDWEYDANNEIESDIDSYEAERRAAGPRLAPAELRLQPGERVDMLLRCGVSPVEVQAAMARAHEEYQKTYGEYPFHGKYGLLILESTERLRMGLKSVVSRRK